MNDINDLKQRFLKLQEWEKSSFILDLLLEDHISYPKLSLHYVEALKRREAAASRKLYKSSMWLEQVWSTIAPRKAFVRAAAAYAILRSGVVHSAPIEKKYIEYLEQNPYSEDENGFPITELKV